MEKEKDLVKDVEFEETLVSLRADISSTRTMLLVFVILAGILKFIFRISFPSLLWFLILGWFLLYFGYEYLVNKTKESEKLHNLYFRYNIIDLLFITIIIHYLGGAEWIGFALYTLVIVITGVIFYKRKTIILGFVALSFYITLVLLEYFGIIPHRPFFLLRPGLYQSPAYLGTQIGVIAALFYFLTKTVVDFSEKLREKARKLREAGVVLEIKVNARTTELQELIEKRGEVIQEKTKELQQRLAELERFQRLVVGRELKMIELKKKIKELEKRLKVENKVNNFTKL